MILKEEKEMKKILELQKIDYGLSRLHPDAQTGSTTYPQLPPSSYSIFLCSSISIGCY